MEHLIDTDILIDFLKDKHPSISLTKLSSSYKLYISIITWIETVFGIKRRSAKPSKRMEELDLLLENLNIKVLNIDNNVAGKYVDLKILQEKMGLPLADFDLFIASTALANNLTLVTRNLKHFSRIPHLKLFSRKSS